MTTDRLPQRGLDASDVRRRVAPCGGMAESPGWPLLAGSMTPGVPWDQFIGEGIPAPRCLGRHPEATNEAERSGGCSSRWCVISRQLGHTDIRSTAREPPLPHASADHSPEQLSCAAAAGLTVAACARTSCCRTTAANQALGSMALPPLTESQNENRGDTKPGCGAATPSSSPGSRARAG